MNIARTPRAAREFLTLVLALAFGAATADAADIPGAPQALNVEAPAFAWTNRALEFEVVQQDRLAGRPLTVMVFLDDRPTGTHKTTGSHTRITLQLTDALAPGVHELRIKSGTFEATDRFRAFSRARVSIWAAGAAGAIALLFGWARAARRKRRGA